MFEPNKKQAWILGGFEFLQALEVVVSDPGVGGSSFVVDGTTSGKVPLAKLAVGTLGAEDPVPGDTTNGLWVNVKASALPAGAATAAKQPALGTAGTPSADVLTVQGRASMTPLLVDGSAVTQPISDGGGSVTTDTNQLPATLGQKTMAASLPVVLASDQASVPVAATLQAGAAAIGKLAANAGVNIGTVDVATVPADPFGANADAASASGSISAKLRQIATNGIPITGTVTVGSHAVSNAGTFAVQDSQKIADNAGFTDGTTPLAPIGFIFDEVAGTALTENDIAAARVNSNRAQVMVIEDETTRGRRLTITAANAMKVDGSGVTQPMSDAGGSITTDSAQLPAALGQTTMANSMSVALASNQSNVPVAGPAAHDAAVSGNPVRVGMRSKTADWTAVADEDTSDLLATILGKQVTMPYALPGQGWTYAGAAGGIVTTSGITIKAAGAAGVRNYLTKLEFCNSHQTISTEIVVRDGASGTVLWRGWAQAAGGGIAKTFDPPLRGSTATLLEVAEITTTGTAGVVLSAQGYSAAE